MAKTSDQNLLFGILAVQMDFINRDQLISAMNTWVLDKTQSLGQVLLKQKVLESSRYVLLEALVQEHLKQHENDPQKSLAAISSIQSVRDDLVKLTDPEIQASLVHVSLAKYSLPPERGGEGHDEEEDHATIGTPTSAGTRFRILRPHAEGGLGKVYIAHDEELKREVALKEIKGEYSDHPESRSRFVLEAEITGGLEHPGIVPVYGLGTYSDGRPFYAMRFIKGDSLKDAIDRYHHPHSPSLRKEVKASSSPFEKGGMGGVEFRKLLQRFIDVCNAIQYAHDRGVLHRDLKPGNIMVGKYGETLVVDWGLAKASGAGRGTSGEKPKPEASARGIAADPPLIPPSGEGIPPTVLGQALGTPAYMSPEQAAGRLDLLGPQSDVYSLGATLFTLLTGQTPVHADNTADILKQVQRGDIPCPKDINPKTDTALEKICLKAMSLHPHDRYPFPRLLAEDIEHWLADEPTTAWPEPLTVKMRRWVGKHRVLVTGTAAALIVGVLGLIAATALLTAANEDLTHERKKVESANEKLLEERNKVQDTNAKLRKTNDDLQKAMNDLLAAKKRTGAVLAQNRWPPIRHWDDLVKRPFFSLRSGELGAKKLLQGVRLGLEGNVFPQKSAFLAYVTVENYSGGVIDRNNLGPVRVEIRNVGALDLEPQKAPPIKGGFRHILEGNFFARTLIVNHPGEYLVFFFMPDDTIMTTAVTATEEESHPWLRFDWFLLEENKFLKNPTLSWVLKKPGVAVPQCDGTKPMPQQNGLPHWVFEKPDPRLKVKKFGQILRLESNDPLHYKQDRFLFRIWKNGKPFAPKKEGIGFRPRLNLEWGKITSFIDFAFDPQSIQAKTGEHVAVQVLYCPDGSCWVDQEPVEGLSNREIEELVVLDRLPLLSNKFEFTVP